MTLLLIAGIVVAYVAVVSLVLIVLSGNRIGDEE
jgi:hypothetical protein